MATGETSLDQDIAARFGPDVPLLVSAHLRPLEGPTYRQLFENRRRWIDGQEVSPVAMHIGAILLDEAFKSELAEIPRLRQYYSGIHSDEVYGEISGDVPIGNTFGTRLIHDLVKMIAFADAERRGLARPKADIHTTYAGVPLIDGKATIPHIDNADSEQTVLRYVATTIGTPTGFSLRNLKYTDVDESYDVRDRCEGYPTLGYGAGGLIMVTMFELHTPHFRPAVLDLARLFTTVDVV